MGRAEERKSRDGRGQEKAGRCSFQITCLLAFSLKGNKQNTNKRTKVLLVLLFFSHVFSSPFLIFLNCFCLCAN